MKKLTVYEINDGRDGVILAKSLKQAVKILAKYYHPYSVKTIIDSIKKCEDFSFSGDWALTYRYKRAKKGYYRRSKMLGWCE